MRKLLVLAATTVAWGAACASPGASATDSASLRIVAHADGRDPSSRTVWTLRCGPVGGSHPARAAACRRLAIVGRRAFLPLPADTACTQIFGDDRTALVTGKVDGRSVWARFSRSDGCRIARYDNLRPILP